jgi:predicted nucleic acid-binding protein
MGRLASFPRSAANDVDGNKGRNSNVAHKDGGDRWNEIARELPALPIEFHPANRAMADRAADFKARFNLSLADAFAAALAKEKKAELVTGDPEFKALDKEIKIQWLK